MHPQFTHRVLGVRSDPPSIESPEFCSSIPPQRRHSMVAPPLFPHGWQTTSIIVEATAQAGWSKQDTQEI